MSLFDETYLLQQYQEAAEDLGNNKLWAYTCSGPIYPYPTFHIDDGILGMRVCGWMEKAYDVTGYLYYEVNKYTVSPEKTEDNYVDVYATSARYDEVNGDGYLLYPGKYYGSDKPFASLRLTAYRDGMDDYDMLCVYEELLEAYAKEHQITDFDFDAYVADLYDTLFDGVVAKNDDKLIYAARNELAQRILALQKEGKLILDPEEAAKKTVTDFAGDVSGVKLSENSTIAAGADGMAQVTIKSVAQEADGSIGSKTKLYRPYISVPVTEFTGTKAIYFTYENVGDTDITMQISLVTESGEKILADTSYCGSGKTRKVRVSALDALEVDLSKVSEIRLSFDNVSTDEEGTYTLLPDKTLKLSDVTLELEE